MNYELRPMSFGEILDTGFRVFRNHFGLLFTVSAVVYGPLLALGLIGGAGPETMQGGMAIAFLVAALVTVLFLCVGMPLANAAITHAIGELYLGRPASLGRSLRVGLSLMMPVAGTTLLAYLLIFLYFLLLVIPGIYMMVAYMLIWQIMVLEGVFGMNALRRSRRLMSGNWWRGVGVVTVYSVLVSVPTALIGVALNSHPFLSSIASNAVQAAGFGLLAALSVVFYFDIRCRKEAFDLQHLAELVEQRAGAAAPAA